MAFEIPSDWKYCVTKVVNGVVTTHKAADFDLKDKTTHNQVIINAYILEKLQFYKITSKTDGRLWEYFKEHFDEWTSAFFHTASTEVRGELRDYLRSHGVFVNHLKRIDYALHDTLMESEQHEWTAEELFKVRRDGSFTSAVYKTPSGSPISRYKATALPPESPKQQEKQEILNASGNDLIREGNIPTKIEDDSYNNIIDQVLKTKLSKNVKSDMGLNYLSLYGTPQDPTTARQLSELTKIYYDDSKKFGGNLFDILDTKLRIFFDQCRKVGLPKDQLPNAYSTMLKSKAADFYYAYLSGKGYDFIKLVQATKEHFETEHNRQEYLSLWRETTLLHLINKNPNKDRNECLEILFHTLSTLR